MFQEEKTKEEIEEDLMEYLEENKQVNPRGGEVVDKKKLNQYPYDNA